MSRDLRDRVVAAVEGGVSCRRAAERFGVSTAAGLPDAQLEAGELYVAPLYNTLIRAGRDIRFSVIPREQVIFCGVPAEYDALMAGPGVY